MKMKKEYFAPEMDMQLLSACDVVTASDGKDNYEDDPFAPLGM